MVDTKDGKEVRWMFDGSKEYIKPNPDKKKKAPKEVKEEEKVYLKSKCKSYPENNFNSKLKSDTSTKQELDNSSCTGAKASCTTDENKNSITEHLPKENQTVEVKEEIETDDCCKEELASNYNFFIRDNCFSEENPVEHLDIKMEFDCSEYDVKDEYDCSDPLALNGSEDCSAEEVLKGEPVTLENKMVKLPDDEVENACDKNKLDLHENSSRIFFVDDDSDDADEVSQEISELETLQTCLESLPPSDKLHHKEAILKTRAMLAYHRRKFTELYDILSSYSFSPDSHYKLQALWLEAHYIEAEVIKGKPLCSVDKLRVRRKFPFPRTIWDGEERVYNYTEKSRSLLNFYFSRSPYPTASEKKELLEATNLTARQISNWFKNRRQRWRAQEERTGAFNQGRQSLTEDRLNSNKKRNKRRRLSLKNQIIEVNGESPGLRTSCVKTQKQICQSSDVKSKPSKIRKRKYSRKSTATQAKGKFDAYEIFTLGKGEYLVSHTDGKKM